MTVISCFVAFNPTPWPKSTHPLTQQSMNLNEAHEKRLCKQFQSFVLLQGKTQQYVSTVRGTFDTKKPMRPVWLEIT